MNNLRRTAKQGRKRANSIIMHASHEIMRKTLVSAASDLALLMLTTCLICSKGLPQDALMNVPASARSSYYARNQAGKSRPDTAAPVWQQSWWAHRSSFCCGFSDSSAWENESIVDCILKRPHMHPLLIRDLMGQASDSLTLYLKQQHALFCHTCNV